MNDKNKCRLCELAKMASADAADLLHYRDLIAPCDRTDETVYNRRLLFCEECPSLVGVTCQSCGCYVQIRAFAKNARCPEKKW
mgnify:FL=1